LEPILSLKDLEIKDKTRVFEIASVAVTGFGKFIFMDFLNLRFVFITAACLFWICYILYRSQQDAGILKYWGLSKTNFKKSFLELLPCMGICIGFFIIAGYRLRSSVITWSIIPVLLLYPIWGIIQQFIIVGLIAGNLKDFKRINTPDWLIIFVTALVFATVHFPHSLLIIGTFLLALAYTKLYLHGRNLIVLGIYHGWLGAFFFYTILGRDAWNELIRMF
jgi:hypothetical protein